MSNKEHQENIEIYHQINSLVKAKELYHLKFKQLKTKCKSKLVILLDDKDGKSLVILYTCIMGCTSWSWSTVWRFDMSDILIDEFFDWSGFGYCITYYTKYINHFDPSIDYGQIRNHFIAILVCNFCFIQLSWTLSHFKNAKYLPGLYCPTVI